MVPRQPLLRSPFSPTVPTGVIVMWSGSVDSIPSGWSLCDGTNGTPDLRDRFVMGAGSSLEIGVTGGTEDPSIDPPSTRSSVAQWPWYATANPGGNGYNMEGHTHIVDITEFNMGDEHFYPKY